MSSSGVDIRTIGPIPKGAILTLAWDYDNFATRKGTTVSSVAWTQTDGSAMSLGTESLGSNVASCTFTAAQTGNSIIECLATFADTDAWPVYFKFKVVEPKTEVGSNTDYGS